MKKFMIAMALTFSALSQAHADVVCQGKIIELNNYNNNENLYILLNSTTHYVYVQTKTSIAMALAAFAAGKQVVFYMSESNITACSGGPSNNSWENLKVVSGWFHVNE